MLNGKWTLSRTVWVAGILAALAAQTASAVDEVVAYGGDALERARAAEAEFQARMSENAESLDRAIKANFDREVEKLELPRLKLALAEVANRG